MTAGIQRKGYGMKVTIDRFEGEYAVLELPDKSFVNVPRKLVSGAKESDVIEIAVEEKETDQRKRRIDQLAGRLFLDETSGA